ncbi:MAG: transposase [Candidatus Aminicenantes bacterium]|nr:MAG: transposase [Candidatus Aminicenantes bacterium]
MPRAKRYYDSGLIWHITHRCHKKEFLLKFSRDRKRYLVWLRQAQKRYMLKVLNYMVTSNHIHLIVLNAKAKKHDDVISRSMQLIAGRTAQEYNQRKNRKGAFWEDRYHSTIIDSNDHLNQCMTYIDMNMVRAGVVSHPMKWIYCGYYEILSGRKRFTIINTQSLLHLFSQKNLLGLVEHRRLAVENAIFKNQYLVRDKKWTEGVAVGRQPFLEKIKRESAGKSRGREIKQEDNSYVLKDIQVPYKANFPPKKSF